MEKEDKHEENLDCDENCDSYKSLCTLNCLLILTKEENLILNLVDNIESPEKKRSKLEK